jgi:hypothetical protein
MLNLTLRAGEGFTISPPGLEPCTLVFVGFRTGGFEVLWDDDQVLVEPATPWAPVPEVSITLRQIDTARRIRASITAPRAWPIIRNDATVSQR